MADPTLLLQALDTAIWELGEAFENLPDEDVWKRPHPRLLSVGELASHIAYGLTSSFVGDSFETTLADARSRYYTTNVDQPFELPLGAAEVYAEVKRVHEACKASFLAAAPDLGDLNPLRDWTWKETLTYMVFHVSYHTGQVYSVRHLLGHETVDN